MSVPGQSSSRVCVRCGRSADPEDTRCGDCGFDLMSDLQQDYDRYRRHEETESAHAAAGGTAPRRRETNPGMPSAVRRAGREEAAGREQPEERAPAFDHTLDMGSATLGRVLEQREPTLDMGSDAASVAADAEARTAAEAGARAEGQERPQPTEEPAAPARPPAPARPRAPTTGRKRRPAPPRPDGGGRAPAPPPRATERGPDTVPQARAASPEPGKRLKETVPLGVPRHETPPPSQPVERPVTRAWGDVFPELEEERRPEPAPPAAEEAEPAAAEPPSGGDAMKTVVDHRSVSAWLAEEAAQAEREAAETPSDAEEPAAAAPEVPPEPAGAAPAPDEAPEAVSRPEPEPALDADLSTSPEPAPPPDEERAAEPAPSPEEEGAPPGPPTGRSYLKEGTTTYVDATRQGFRREETSSGGGSVGLYVGIGVGIGLAALAVFYWLTRA